MDECASSVTNGCDDVNGDCTNQEKTTTYPLGYTCSCNSGYELSPDGFTCTDVNECNSATRGGCDQGCINKVGSYDCYCSNGFELSADRLTCDDIDECSSSQSHNCYSASYCNNTNGGYGCSCPSDFYLKVFETAVIVYFLAVEKILKNY